MLQEEMLFLSYEMKKNDNTQMLANVRENKQPLPLLVNILIQTNFFGDNLAEHVKM